MRNNAIDEIMKNKNFETKIPELLQHYKEKINKQDNGK